jgi:bile acid-coenzyme A ligase
VVIARSRNYTLPPDFSPVALGTLASRWAMEDPRRPAITCGNVTTRWQELDARANRRARALAALGVGPDDLVTVLLPNSVAFYETSIALWKLGATPNPVSPRLPDHELREIVALARPKLIIGVEDARLPGYATLPAQFEPDPELSSEPLPERLARYWRACTPVESGARARERRAP